MLLKSSLGVFTGGKHNVAIKILMGYMQFLKGIVSGSRSPRYQTSGKLMEKTWKHPLVIYTYSQNTDLDILLFIWHCHDHRNQVIWNKSEIQVILKNKLYNHCFCCQLIIKGSELVSTISTAEVGRTGFYFSSYILLIGLQFIFYIPGSLVGNHLLLVSDMGLTHKYLHRFCFFLSSLR